MKKALVTGAAGFIGFHVSKALLEEGWTVIGVDALTDYYEVSLKENREKILRTFPKYSFVHRRIEEQNMLLELFSEERPNVVIHLAAQAGVRFSIENPQSYLQSNIVGTYELLEAARRFPPEHLLCASTSSVYGASLDLPFKEIAATDHQMSFYAATKKSMEVMAHSYSHLFNLPITCFRFFTVYGPWGRPDMALFKFVKGILEDKPIDVYNSGKMARDFTYIEDITTAIKLLIKAIPSLKEKNLGDSRSPVASFRTVNIGNSKEVPLLKYIEAIEKTLGQKAKKNFLPMQPGDVKSTVADTSLLKSLTGFSPEVSHEKGVEKFIVWYREYYEK